MRVPILVRTGTAVAVSLLLAACGSSSPTQTVASVASSSAAAPAASVPAASVPAAAPTAAVADAWSTFRGDAARRGEGSHGPVGQPVLRWRFQAGGSVNPPPAIVAGIVYAISDDGVLHALSEADGRELWTFAHAQSPQVGATVDGGTVYVTDRDGIVWAVDASSGKERWRTSLPYQGGLVAGGGSLFISSIDAIVALDASNGAQRWRYPAPGAGEFHAPAYGSGLVFAASDSGGFVALDAATGVVRWHADTGEQTPGTAVVADGIAYIGTSDDKGGHLRAFDAVTGALRWIIDEAITSPAVSGGVAFSGGSAGYVSAHDTATGGQLWRFPVQGTARPLGVAQGVVYVPADAEHRVYALDAKTGAQLWHFDVDGGIDGSLAIADGSVYVGTSAGSVYAIGGDGSTAAASPTLATPAAPSPTEAGTASPSVQASPGTTGQSLARVLWAGTEAAGVVDWPNGMALDPEGRLWVASTGQNSGQSRLAIFDPDVTTPALDPGPSPHGHFVAYWGAQGSGAGQFSFIRANGDGYGGIAFAPDGSFYVLDTGNRRIEHFDKSRAFLSAWGGFGTAPGKYVDPVALSVDGAGDVHVFDDDRGVVETTDASGRVIRTLRVDVPQHSGNGMAIDAAGDAYLAIGGDVGNDVLEYGPTGTLLRSIGPAGAGTSQFDAQVGAVAVDDQGRIFVGLEGSATVDNVFVFDKDAHLLGTFGPSGDAANQLGFVFGLLPDDHGDLYVADATNNRIEKFRLLDALAPATPLDGTWQTCFTRADWNAARDAGKVDPTDPPQADKNCVTVTFGGGLTDVSVGDGSYVPLPPRGANSTAYVVSGSRLVTYQPTGEVFLFTWRLANGTLTLGNVPPGWSGPTWPLVKPFARKGG